MPAPVFPSILGSVFPEKSKGLTVSVNQRQVLLNRRFRICFLFYALFSVLVIFLFLGWEVLVEYWINNLESPTETIQSLRGFPMAVKLTLLLLWGVFSFLLAYTFLDARFIGVFNRMDRLFREMLHNNDIHLHFRARDPFAHMGESFNTMKTMFLTRIQRRKDLIASLTREIEALPANPTRETVDQIIEKIDKELSH